MGAAWEVEKHGQERSVRSEGQGLGEKHHGIFKLCNTKKPSCLVKMGVGAACGGRVAWEKKCGLHHLDILTLSGVGHCPDVVKIYQDGGGGGLWRAGGVGKNPRFARSAHTSSRCNTSAPDDYI
jgi:hypothetical protein